MLKYFYKTLFVSILCGSLLMLDFSYKGLSVGVNSLRAETLQTSKAEEEANLSSTLVMTAVGLLTSRLYQCKLTTDMMIAAAGGAAFLAGEVTSFFQEKQALKGLEMEIERDRKGAPTQQQIAILEKLKKSYEEAKKTATLKKTFQQAAAAAFLAAAAVAGYMYATETAAQAACRTALVSATTTCASLCAACAGVVTCACPTCCAAAGPLGTETAQRSAKYVKDLVTQPSAAADATNKATLAGIKTAQSASMSTCAAGAAQSQAACGTSDMLELTTRGVCMKPLAVGMMRAGHTLFAQNHFTPVRPVIPKMDWYEMIFMPSAHADLLSPMGIASSTAVSFVLMTSATLGMQIDTFMFSPMNRAIVWGVLAGLAFTAGSAIQNQIAKIEGNIAKIDAILNSMYGYANGVKGSQTPGGNSNTIDRSIDMNRRLNLNQQVFGEVDLKAQGAQLPCITGDDPNNCPSFSNKLMSQPDLKTLPEGLQSTLSTVAKVTDGLNGSGKISSSTISEASTLGSKANALKSDFDRRKKEMQEALKNAGSKRDLDKEGSQVEKDMKTAIQKELDNRKMTAEQMLASFGGGKGSAGLGGLGGAGAVATDANANQAKDLKGKKGSAGVNIPVVAIPAAQIPKINDKELADSLKADQEKAAKEAALSAEAEAKAAANANIEDYEIKNDITKEKDSSIFDLISNRYQKSGYPRLFKRIK